MLQWCLIKDFECSKLKTFGLLSHFGDEFFSKIHVCSKYYWIHSTLVWLPQDSQVPFFPTNSYYFLIFQLERLTDVVTLKLIETNDSKNRTFYLVAIEIGTFNTIWIYRLLKITIQFTHISRNYNQYYIICRLVISV